MKLDFKDIANKLIVALLLAGITTAYQTYVEVKLLRKDMARVEQRLEKIEEELWVALNDAIQGR